MDKLSTSIVVVSKQSTKISLIFCTDFIITLDYNITNLKNI